MTQPIVDSYADPYVMNSHGMINGETVQQWTQDWWTWTLQSPYATSPQLDTAGDYAYLGDQKGKMFFLAGTFGGDMTREFSVKAGEPLLVPIVNDLVFQFTGRGPDPATGGKGAANILLSDWRKGISDMFLTIDGHPVQNLQSDFVRTDWFSPGVAQAGSLVEAFGITGELGPAKTAGYWAVLNGFSPDTTHTIEFGSVSGGVKVTDTIHFT